MQSPKSRNSSSTTAPHKSSPRSVSSSTEASQKVTPRVVSHLKTSPRYFEHTASSLKLASKPLKEQSPKASDHRSPREKKRQSRVSELESQVTLLENNLNTVKDQLCATEASEKLAEKDAEEANHQILALSLKLGELQKEVSNNLSSKDALFNQELTQESKSEKYSSDSAALASALEEIKRLKLKHEVATESEATHSKNSEAAQAELNQLKQSLSETLLLVEEMRSQLKQSEESEARAQAIVRETLMQLEKSRARVNSLEEIVNELKPQINANNGGEDAESAETEDGSVKMEVQQLRYAVEAAEVRYNEEQARSKEQMRNAIEMAETIKSESRDRETKLEAEIQTHKDMIEELKAMLLDKETELQGICEEKEGLTKKLQTTLSTHGTEFKQEHDKTRAELDNLKALLTDKENEWQNIIQENERLKPLVNERSPNTEDGEINAADVESVRASEKEALTKVGNLTEEVYRSNRKLATITEQLDAAQSTNSEMAAELRRIKIQSDQWRKAAEAAAAILSAGGGQLMERTKSDDLDEDLLKMKKNANMLRRFWKKPQK